MNVPFNQPYLPKVNWNRDFGSNKVLRTQGKFYDACRALLDKKFGFNRTILTPSCTGALEIIALALDIKPGDEVILPSYTFVSTANAFALRGASLIFADTLSHHPAVNLKEIESLMTPKTKAIIIVHYGGFAIDYKQLNAFKKKYSIPIIEDAAHCIGSTYGNKFIGSIGDFATFSFHETKNISCGMGGALVVNNTKYWLAANEISQCGTNKLDFIKGKVAYYSWQNLGSNYLLAEPLCAVLFSGLKDVKRITTKRLFLARRYEKLLKPLTTNGDIEISPVVDEGNGHIFYLVVRSKLIRDQLLLYLKKSGIEATFHYSPLHQSDFFREHNKQKISLSNTEKFASCLIRLPLFYTLTNKQQDFVVKKINSFFE